MPIVRSYMCTDCGHHMDVTYTMEEVDAPPPDCPNCAKLVMHQDFKPPGIIGSNRSRATALTEDILQKDYGVADFQRERSPGGTPKVRYADQTAGIAKSSWGQVGREALESAVALGRQSRLKHGSGLDVLQQSLQSGAQPDLIEISKRRAIKVW